MKVSELIKFLENILKKHGDVPVKTGFGCEDADEIREEDILFFDETHWDKSDWNTLRL